MYCVASLNKKHYYINFHLSSPRFSNRYQQHAKRSKAALRVLLTHLNFVDCPGLEYSQHCFAEKNQPVYCIPELWSHEKCLKKTVKIACHCLVDKTNKPYNERQIKNQALLIHVYVAFTCETKGKGKSQNCTNLSQTLLMCSCHLRNMMSMKGSNYFGTSCWHYQQVFPLNFPASQRREIHVIKVELRLTSQSHCSIIAYV